MRIFKPIKQLLSQLANRPQSLACCCTAESKAAHDVPYYLHSYLNDDGTFDYETYRRIQTEGNKRKLDRVFVRQENITHLSELIKQRQATPPRFGLCHGTRRGVEQQWFREQLNCDVIGTEVSDTATQFPYTIQWDFHEVKPEWIGHFDFIYSNSFDHSYDPEKCLNAWMSCLQPDGICIIEHTNEHGPEHANELDPFGAHISHMPYLVLLWGKGRFAVTEVVQLPRSHQLESQHTSFLIIERLRRRQYAVPEGV